MWIFFGRGGGWWYNFTNPAARFAYGSSYQIYLQKPIMICWMYVLAILRFMWHIINPYWTEWTIYGIVTQLHCTVLFWKKQSNNVKKHSVWINSPLDICSQFSEVFFYIVLKKTKCLSVLYLTSLTTLSVHFIILVSNRIWL